MEELRFGGMIYGGGHKGESCEIQVSSSGLEISVSKEAVGRLPWSTIQLSATGTDDKYLKFESRSSAPEFHVLTGNKAIVDAIRSAGAPMQMLNRLDSVAATRRRRSAGRTGILIAIIGFFVVLIGGMFFLVRPAASALTAHIPTEWEVELGRSESEKLLAAHQTCTNPDLNRAVAEIGSRLVMGMGETPYEWHIKVLDSEEINAFALPGGYVFINRGLIEAADSPDEVAGVLAHEFQHVLKRHGMKNVVANIGLRLMLMAVFGDVEAVQGFLLDNMAQLAAMKFSRGQETEADMGAVELAYKSEISPGGFLSFMKKLEEKESEIGALLTIVSTHPGSAERMDDISARIQEKGDPRPTPFASDWKSIQTLCDPAEVLTPDELAY